MELRFIIMLFAINGQVHTDNAWVTKISKIKGFLGDGDTVTILSDADVDTSHVVDKICRSLHQANVASYHYEGIQKRTIENSIVVVVNDALHFQTRLDIMRNKTEVASSARVMFIFLDDSINVTAFARKLWENNRLLNFGLMYYNKEVKVTCYNPFLKKMSTYSQDLENFPIFRTDKLSNMHGYPLKVSLFEYKPRIVQINGQFYGRDVMVLDRIIWQLNASKEVVVPEDHFYSGAFTDMVNGKSDILFVPGFLDNSTSNASVCGYPYIRDDFVIVAPKAPILPLYKNISLTFNREVWVLLGMTILTLSVIFLLSDYRNYMEIVRILVNSGTPILKESASWKKVLIIFYIEFAIIMSIAFQSSLTSALMIPRHMKDLETVADLDKSSYTVIVSKVFMDVYKPQTYFNAPIEVVDTKAYLINMMKNKSDGYCYVISKTTADMCVDYVSRKYRQTVYHILQQSLVPGYSAFHFPIGSPYVDKINQLVLRDQEHGFTGSSVLQQVLIEETIREERMVDQAISSNTLIVLTFSHLQTAFYILGFGYGLSAAVFVAEVICSRIRNSTN